MQEKTKEIATIKQAVRLQQWSEQVQEQQASGLSIKQWCDENGIKTNTYTAAAMSVRDSHREERSSDLAAVRH